MPEVRVSRLRRLIDEFAADVRCPLPQLPTAWQLRPQLDYLTGHLSEIEAACLPELLVDTMAKLKAAQQATVALPSRAELARRRRAARRASDKLLSRQAPTDDA